MDNLANTKQTTHENATLELTNKSISAQDYVMQISNISQASIGTLPKKKASAAFIGTCILVSFICFLLSSMSYRSNSLLIFFGVTSIIILILYLVSNNQQSQKYGLLIELNSGRNMFFVSENKPFLNNMLHLIDKRIQQNNMNQDVYIAHFEKGSIENITHNGSGDINANSRVYRTEYINN